MREIKFRVWNTLDGFMSNFVSLVEYNGDWFVSFDDGTYEGKLGTDVFLLQYTGLKDKNKKDIYQKDICRFVNTEGAVIIGVVDYRDDRASWFFKNIEISRLFDSGFYQPSSDPCGSNSNGWPGNGLEVIGNIYENPELLD